MPLKHPAALPPSRPSPRLTFHLIPHTHWDREWYLPRASFQARLVPVLDRVVEQLEQDHAARFVLDGQTVLVEDYLAVRPEQERRIASLVERGALEVGPWYVLSDLLIPSARSLHRNLELGARDAARYGKRLEVLYSPDAFGHPAELPALAAEHGLSRAVVRRGLGRPAGRDRDLYRWSAPGGKQLLVHHLPTAGYDLAIDLAGSTTDFAAAWARVRGDLVDRAATPEIGVLLGADHHAMVRDLSGLRARVQALEPDHDVTVSGLGEFFEAVERARPHVARIRGELRAGDGHAWVLQGVHSARSRLKRRHGTSEWLLSRIAETLAQGAAAAGGAGLPGLLDLAWKTLLQSQFHDTLAGTTSDAVQREQSVRLDTVDALSCEIATTSLHHLAGYDPDLARDRPEDHPPRLVLWNPALQSREKITTAELSFFRSDVLVGAPSSRRPRLGGGYRPFALDAGAGGLIPVQVLAVRADQIRSDTTRHYPDQDEVDRVWIAFATPALPGHGLVSLGLRNDAGRAPEVPGLEVGQGVLTNPFVTVRVSRGGSFTLEDRRTGERYPGLCELEDEPDRGDLYTFSRGDTRSILGGRHLSQRVLAGGPLVAAIETRWTMRSAGEGEIGVRQVVVVHADSPVVRLRLDLTNEARDHRLRARFPVGVGEGGLAGTALGSIWRGVTDPDGDRDQREHATATAPAHRFVSAGAGARGLAVLSTGFFEYEWCRERDLAITLLRSVGVLSRSDLPERPGHAAWPMPTPDAQEEGGHTISLALVLLEAFDVTDPLPAERAWEEAFLPVQGFLLGGPVGK